MCGGLLIDNATFAKIVQASNIVETMCISSLPPLANQTGGTAAGMQDVYIVSTSNFPGAAYLCKDTLFNMNDKDCLSIIKKSLPRVETFLQFCLVHCKKRLTFASAFGKSRGAKERVL